MEEMIDQLEDVFTVETIFGHETRKGIVRIGYGLTFDLQMSPKEARKIATDILEAADAAESDEFLVKFLMGTVGVPLEGAAAVLQEFRAAREDFRKEQPK